MREIAVYKSKYFPVWKRVLPCMWVDTLATNATVQKDKSEG